MSKVCKCTNGCPYAPQQTTAGCPAAELCPGYTDPIELEYGTGTVLLCQLYATNGAEENSRNFHGISAEKDRRNENENNA